MNHAVKVIAGGSLIAAAVAYGVTLPSRPAEANAVQPQAQSDYGWSVPGCGAYTMELRSELCVRAELLGSQWQVLLQTANGGTWQADLTTSYKGDRILFQEDEVNLTTTDHNFVVVHPDGKVNHSVK